MADHTAALICLMDVAYLYYLAEDCIVSKTGMYLYVKVGLCTDM